MQVLLAIQVQGLGPFGDGKMSEQLISEMTAEEAISRKLNTYVELRPHDRDARSLAMRCKEIAALLEAPSAYHRLRVTDPGPEVMRPHWVVQV